LDVFTPDVLVCFCVDQNFKIACTANTVQSNLY
jgi:hypothetical protein